MSKPTDTLWEYEEHTQAKHRLLVGYLHAWYPIMASNSRTLNVIDGFAGPGRYTGGEPGSPLLMIEAFADHKNRTPAMERAEIHFDFIEERHDRVEFLRNELSRVTLPPNVHIDGVHEGSFDKVMGDILDGIPSTSGLAPTFAFIDPFGYTGHGLQLSSRILQFSKCEVLIYVPLPHIARFIETATVERALDNLYGDSAWKDARAARGKDAKKILHERFLERVRRAAGHAIAFEIDASPGKGWAGGFNQSSQHLVMEVIGDGCSKTAAGSSCAAWSDVVAGAAIDGAARGSDPILGVHRAWRHERGCRGGGGRFSCGRHALVPSGWRHVTHQPGPGLGALPVVRRTGGDLHLARAADRGA
jgi:three-Cys-motif partner protein